MKSNKIPKLIISCQFRPDDVLNKSSFIKAIIKSVVIEKNTIVRIHAKYINHVHKLGAKCISLIKLGNKTRWINPTAETVKQSIKSKPYAVAIESTYLLHKYDSSLLRLYKLVKEKSPKTIIIADIATTDDAIRAERLGANIIATTLARIPERGGTCRNHKDHCRLVKKLSNKVAIPIIAEGIIQTPKEARELLKNGALSVVIGHHIIHPGHISRYFNSVINYDK